MLLAERLGVAPLARLDPPRLGELVEAAEQLLGIVERLDQGADTVGLDEVDPPLPAGPWKVSTTVSGCWLRIVRADGRRR